jgi:hypothetical protein
MPESLLWAYGVVPGSQPPQVRVEGLEGRPVEPVVNAGLAVLASAVPSDRFSGDVLERRLEDIETLGRIARAHDRVLEVALQDGDVVPFRVGTLYETPEAMRDMLAAEADRFETILARVRGKVEWGVKGFAEPRAVAAAVQERPSSGREYLARRRAQLQHAEATGEAVATAAAEVHARLARSASAAVLAAPQDRRLTGRDTEMVLNGAYLVARDEAEDFAALVGSMERRHEGLALELTGAWPPYHFVTEPPA